MAKQSALKPKAILPITNATPAANKPPTIQDNNTGNPRPPRKPVFAGSIDSIFSIAGAEINLIKIIPIIIIDEITNVLFFIVLNLEILDGDDIFDLSPLL